VTAYFRITFYSDYVGGQVVSLPNLRIIDFGYGFTGSTHDSTAWEETRLAKEHETLLEDGEFIWADLAYTVRDLYLLPNSDI
jgi:hypothetical protein